MYDEALLIKSTNELSKKFEAFMALSLQSFDAAIKKTAMGILTELKASTPVDTGRARISWALDFNKVSNYLPEGYVKGVGKTRYSAAEIEAHLVSELKKLDFHVTPKDGTWFIYTNIKYMRKLEFEDHSPQNQAFVRAAVARAISTLEKQFKIEAKARGVNP